MASPDRSLRYPRSISRARWTRCRTVAGSSRAPAPHRRWTFPRGRAARTRRDTGRATARWRSRAFSARTAGPTVRPRMRDCSSAGVPACLPCASNRGRNRIERLGRASRPGAAMHQGRVGRDAVEPRSELRLAAKRRQVPVDLQEGLLQHVGRIGVARQTARQSKDARLVPPTIASKAESSPAAARAASASSLGSAVGATMLTGSTGS